ncbi:hypothetical protein CHS0354_024320 [Potamilus streckersoni]|uniref:Uncharacterized protein n=1 Tax=Potamilus streckersoni TaxID=2493646 RepID=A0AAE0VGG3_9BIVA|nr:hypothetical protein CHS0354_024320 [Potamilus streckersoni]
MGKRKDSTADHSLEDPGSSSHRKHKKHKKKHKKRSHEDEEHLETVSDIGGSPKTAIKLKLKIGGMTLSTKKYLRKPDKRVSYALKPSLVYTPYQANHMTDNILKILFLVSFKPPFFKDTC